MVLSNLHLDDLSTLGWCWMNFIQPIIELEMGLLCNPTRLPEKSRPKVTTATNGWCSKSCLITRNGWTTNIDYITCFERFVHISISNRCITCIVKCVCLAMSVSIDYSTIFACIYKLITGTKYHGVIHQWLTWARNYQQNCDWIIAQMVVIGNDGTFDDNHHR